MPLNSLKKFLQMESTAGLLLVAAAALALLLSNTPLFGLYQYVLNVPLVVSLGELGVNKPLLLWINDGLMAIFFMLIGLEVKREVFEGELRTASQIALPAVAGIGGFFIPALIYVSINWHSPAALEGWAVPAATDIAFALGVLTLLGSRVPLSLKVFLTTIAIFDDLAAIVVIALFYADNLSVQALMYASLGVAVLFAMNRARVMSIAPYIIIGTFVWFCVLKSGVHATLAGILVAFAIPMRSDDEKESPVRHLEHALHPWVAFLILPLFAFANAGLSFAGIPAEVLTGSVTIGIAVSLFFGKQIGVFMTTWLMIRFGLARLPEGANWLSIYGISLLAGIGFTMSLFIGTLAFETGQVEYLAATRVGVLAGSILSAAAGYVVLRLAFRNSSPRADTTEAAA
jgi:NhaA family Na+:H+ antiporter